MSKSKLQHKWPLAEPGWFCLTVTEQQPMTPTISHGGFDQVSSGIQRDVAGIVKPLIYSKFPLREV